MKQKMFKKTLTLNKLTISALNTEAMQVRGGVLIWSEQDMTFCPGGTGTVEASCPGYTVSRACFQAPQGACC